MNANEARTNTEKCLHKQSIENLVKIYDEIKKECEKGSYELFYRGVVSKEAAAELKSKGYKVKYSAGEFDDFGNYYEGYVRINWRRRNNWKIRVKNMLQRI